MTLDEFVNKYNNKKVDLFSCAKSGKMNNTMASSIGQHKILQSIIRMISVNVMNYILRIKFTTQKLFINKSVSFVLPIWMSIPNHMFLLTDRGTIHKLSKFMTFEVFKLFTAVITIKDSLPRFVVTFSITKPSFLTGWCFKSFLALFATIYHNLYYRIHCVEVSI